MKTIGLFGLLIGCISFGSVNAQIVPGVSTPGVPATSKPTVMGTVRDSASVSTATSQSATSMTTDSTDAQLDKSVTALESGNKAASTQALQSGIAGLEASASKTSFKDKIMAQVGKLKAILPLIAGGGIGAGGLRSAIGLAKMASNAGKLEGIMSAGSLLGKAGSITSGLSGISGGLSALGGGAQSSGQSLITTALGSVGKLDQGGLAAKAAEPVVKTQVGSVLNFVKGAL
ncbi:hypothetical protein [Spirosoma rhododendri]|uniref:hypothetical protein n=1 Tax=Spirosoma rhododendri TaxID=2728024 RepID=UPI0020C23830|nr:hypothetical protein [Spirosoma rhododendri]